ncbi:nucleotidyl transferase family protein [Anaerosacchariphilus polymeriproducens]|nr:hypothetical protein [Anaerosacchariphilus polymeriproducens]
MIRFCDMEVYTIDENQIDRNQLLRFFCEDRHNNDIVVVYNNLEEFVGIITYDTLLFGNDEILQKEKLITSEDIWENAKKIFDIQKNVMYVPVFNDKSELIYFCYNDNSNEDYYNQINIAFEQLEQNEDSIFIKELYRNVEVVCIYDMNEFAFRLYKLLNKRKIDVLLIGDKWRDICGIEESSNNVYYPDYSKMNILAEPLTVSHIKKDRTCKKRIETVNSFEFLLDIIRVNCINSRNQMKEELQALGANIILCRIPEFNDLNHYTLDEYYRCMQEISPNNLNINDKNKLNSIQLKKAFGDTVIESDSKSIYSEIDNMKSLKLSSRKYSEGENTIYIIGPCIVNGQGVNQNESFSFYMSQFVTQKFNQKFAVITISVPSYMAFLYHKVIENLDIKENDIILCMYEKFSKYEDFIQDKVDICLSDYFDSRKENEEWFFDKPIHTTKLGNMKIAEELVYNCLSKLVDNMDLQKEQQFLQKRPPILTEDEIVELKKYVNSIQQFEAEPNQRIGSIVMNCNPFTLGHKYLIDCAMQQVDYLYLFVVEENRSEFLFEDRFKLVKAGTASYPNIRVVPSGRFILSYETMPIYFEKAKKQDAIVDASMDIEIFARYIAAELGITVRFAGEEPIDKVTRQYNQEMKKTLSKYNIEFIEIARETVNEDVISASKVRKLLKEEAWEELKKFVPLETYLYLKNGTFS